MRFAVSLFILPLLVLLATSPAHAARLSFVGIVNSSEPNEPGTTYTGVPAYGAGVLLEFRMLPMIGIEFGALSTARKFDYKGTVPNNFSTTVEGKMYEFPVLLRAHLGSLLSLGFGGYYARAIGDAGFSSTINGIKISTSQSYASLRQSTSDYGVVTSAALYLRLIPLVRFVIDGRYTIGVKDNDLGPGTRKYNDMQLLAGLQIGF